MGRPAMDSAPCDSAADAWESFVGAFVDFAVGGHVLPPSRPPAAAAGATSSSRPDSPNAGPYDSTENPRRIVAVGDVHGDIEKTREALKLAGLIDSRDSWSGGDTVLVQVGDVLDRGGGEIEIFYLLEKLRHEAAKAGGAVHTLLGNHETGNAEGWLKYASKDGVRDFRRWAAWERWGNHMTASCRPQNAPQLLDPEAGVPSGIHPEFRARFAALKPTGKITERFIASNPVTVRLGETLFVHGGVLPEHVEYGLGRINREAGEWLRSTPTPEGVPQRAPFFFHTAKAIVWVRDYSHSNPSECRCDRLERTLGMLPGVSRMIMGHTIQEEEGVNAACGGKAIRVDVGMSKGCGDYAPQVLEILNGQQLRVLTRQGSPQPLEVHAAPGSEKQGLAALLQRS